MYYGVEGELLSLLECYLRDRKQMVVLNGQNSNWRKKVWCTSGVSIRSPFILDIYKLQYINVNM